MSVLCTKAWAFSKAGLSSSYDCMMAGQNKCKEKVRDVSDPNQNVETPNSSLHNLKIYSSKVCRETSQRWIYVAS